MTRLTVVPPGLTDAARRKLAAAMSEDELQENIRELCDVLRLPVQHIHDSRRCWLPGWPDLVIFGGCHVLWRELKSETNRISAEQRSVGSVIGRAGGDWAVWRPCDWVNGIIRRQLEAIAGTREMF